LANSVKVQEKKAEYQAEKGKVLNSLWLELTTKH
jgi:hypothetical protein